MYIRLVLPIALLAVVSCKDIEQGLSATEARKIFDEKREASPAVWRQVDKVTVNTTDAEVISRVVVTDLRPNKDGDASIVEGGEGNQTVTIELKSPTVLRGYDFHIEVFAVPDTKGHDVNTPAIIGNDKTKNQWKPNEDDLRLNIGGDIKPPSTFGADSSTKPPVPLSTDFKINDGKRITRNSEEAKKIDAASNNPISFVDTKSSETDPAKKVPLSENKETELHNLKGLDQADKPHKGVEASTHLPTTTVGLDLKQKDEHVRHARDTEKKTQSTTQAPSTTVKATKDLKDNFGPEMVYPQWHVDKISENTDKLLIPADLEPTQGTKDVNAEKDGRSTAIPSSTFTTSTLKPRVVRDTEVTTPKSNVKDNKQQDDKLVQKIPSSGLVTIPKEWTNVQNSTAPKIGLENQSEESETPQNPPIFPAFNQEQTKNGPTVSTTAKSVKIGHPSSSSEASDSSESSEHVKPVGFSAPKHSGF